MMIVLALAMMASGAVGSHRYAGETFDCHFPKTGHVLIDTRKPGGTITINNKRWPSEAGSDHYYTSDDNATYMFFYTSDMSHWANRDTNEPSVPCSRRKNKG